MRLPKEQKKQEKKIVLGAVLLALLLVVFSTVLVFAEGTEIPNCEHVHTEACYRIPEDHVHSIEDGCVPVYPTRLELVQEGNTNLEDWYIDGDVEKGLIEGHPEIEEKYQEVPDTDAEPISWKCNHQELVCEHKDCIVGAPCRVAIAQAEANPTVRERLINTFASTQGVSLAELTYFDNSEKSQSIALEGNNNLTTSYKMLIEKMMTLSVKASFNATGVTYADRTLTIKIAPGLEFDVLPGFSWDGTQKTWVFNKNNLPVQQKDHVIGGSFVADTIPVNNTGNHKLTSGTVTYQIGENVGLVELIPVIKYSTQLVLNGDPNGKNIPNAVVVTTNAKKNGAASSVVDTQTLENLLVKGIAGIMTFRENALHIIHKPGMTGQSLKLPILLFQKDIKENNQIPTYDIFYIEKAGFDIQLPPGINVSAVEFELGGGTAGRTATITGSSKQGMKIHVDLEKIMVGKDNSALRNIILKYSVDSDAPLTNGYTADGKYNMQFSKFYAQGYGSSQGYTTHPEEDAGKAYPYDHRIEITDTLPELVQINDSGHKSAMYPLIGFGYVPSIINHENTPLGSYTLWNKLTTPSALQTVKMDFTKGLAVGKVRMFFIPVGASKTAPHVRVTLNTGAVVEVANFNTSYRRGDNTGNTGIIDYVVFDLSTQHPSGSPTDYIVSAEYEIDQLLPNYGNYTSAYRRVDITPTLILGSFTAQGPGVKFEFDVKVAAGSIASNNGQWDGVTANQCYSMIRAPHVQFEMDKGPVGQTFQNKKENLYYLEPRIRVYPAISTDQRYVSSYVTYVEGVDVYLRTMGKIDIDTSTIQIRQVLMKDRQSADSAILNQGTYVNVPQAQITPMTDNQGTKVYRLRLPQAYLNSYGSKDGNTTALQVRYGFKVNDDVPREEHDLSELIWVQPIDKAHKPFVGFGTATNTNADWTNSTDIAYWNQLNRYDVAGDGKTDLRYGTLRSEDKFYLEPNLEFVVKTDAKLIVNGSSSDWKTSNSKQDAIELSPLGTFTYRYTAQNLSGQVAGKYVVHIPIPEVGKGASSGFTMPDKSPAEFEWTAELISEVRQTVGTSMTVSYSTQYVPDTTNTSSFGSWSSISNKASIRTIRIEYTTPMADKEIHEYQFDLKVGGTQAQKDAWLTAGATNYYSSVVTPTLTNIQLLNMPTEPIAVKLAGGLIVGRVYIDKNRNGKYDAGDVPVANHTVDGSIASGVNAGTSQSIKTNAEGLFQFLVSEGDNVSIVTANPEYASKMLRFYGDSKVNPSKTVTGQGKNNADIQVEIGLIEPYKIQFDDNTTNNPSTFEPIYRYPDETISGPHEVPDKGPTPPTASQQPDSEFQEWNNKPDGSGSTLSPNGTVGGDETYYAVREKGSLAVTYDKNTTDMTSGSVPVDSKLYLKNEKVIVKANPGNLSRPGYGFKGWSTTPTGTTPITEFNITQNTILYAIWEADVYYVTYDGNGHTGGSVPVDSQGYKLNDTATLKPQGNMVKDGYVFKGWATSPENAKNGVVWAYDSCVVKGNHTFYAVWEEAFYKLIYDGNGHTSGSVPVDNSAYKKGITATLQTSTTIKKDGYTFKGWSSTPNGTTPITSVTFSNSDITVYAIWEQSKYTVKYDGNGHTGGTVPVDNHLYVAGETGYLKPQGDMVRAGYEFKGWSAQPNGTVWPTNNFTVTGNHIFYAVWEAKIYHITYDGNGHTGGTAPVDSKDYRYNDKVTLADKNDLEKTGYTFKGWSTQASGGTIYPPGTVLPVTQDQTYYAIWDVKEPYTLTYEGNGHTGGSAPPSSKHVEGTTAVLVGNINNLSKTGYVFAGWSLTKNGPKIDTVLMDSDKTVYAIWSLGYRLIYDGNGHTGGFVPIDLNLYLYGDTATIQANPGNLVRDGYTFIGWSITPDGMPLSSDKYIITSNAILYAVWDHIGLKVTYDGNGHTGGDVPIDPTAYAYGDIVPIHGNDKGLVKDGYVFDGCSFTAAK